MINIAFTAMHGPAGGRVQCWGTYVIGNKVATELLHFHGNGTQSVLVGNCHFPRREMRHQSRQEGAWLCTDHGRYNRAVLLHSVPVSLVGRQQNKLTTLAWRGCHANVVSLLVGAAAQAGSPR